MNTYEMDPRLRPLFSGIFFAGIATTAEFNIVNRTIPRMSYDEFDGRQYKRNPDGTTHPAALWPAGHNFGAPDEVHVIDTKLSRCGLLGSNNVLNAKIEGSVGFIIDGACRELERVHRPGISGLLRGAIHATYVWPPRAGIRQPADHMCGGVYVRPGDGIIADDDGIVVIPQEDAEESRQACLDGSG